MERVLGRATVVRRALERVSPSGRFSADDLPALRDVADSVSSGAGALDHPADLFGPWEELTPPAQSVLRTLVERDITRAMDFFPDGTTWTGLVRGARELDRFLYEREGLGRFRGDVVTLAGRLHGGPATARARMRAWRSRRRWRKGIRCGPGDLLAVLSRSPQWLLGDYVEGVRVDPRARGFHHDTRRNVLHGYYIGLDLLPTPSGIVCLEANLRPGILDGRLTFTPDNPMVDGVIAAAQAMRARRLVWLEGPPLPLRDWMVTALNDAARRADLDVEILEDPCIPRRQGTRPGIAIPERWSLRTAFRRDTLVMRRNEFPVGPDYVLSHKEPSIRSLHGYIRRRPGAGFRVLPMTRVPEHVPRPTHPGLPNLVYKYPDSIAGQGVFFIRARDTEHALSVARDLDLRFGEPPGLFQDFVCSHLLEGDRVYDVRAEIFLSPEGCRYLIGMRREAAKSLPEKVPSGLIRDTGIYTSNLATGGHLNPVPHDDEPAFREAALAVGEAFGSILRSTFVTESSEA